METPDNQEPPAQAEDAPAPTEDAPAEALDASAETVDASAETVDAPAETLDAVDLSGGTDTQVRAPGGGRHQVLDKGARMGRYVALRRLGAGGMGTVYLGYDPELDRKVALKLLHGDRSEDKRRSLLREAQAMARLKHPNVVTVHDVGEHRGHVYVAMEFVEGRTLKCWGADERRPWREVLEVFLLAGRGLQAAHEEQLIHRDFKPDNVMVSKAGDVVVMDFGLARSRESPAEEDMEVSALRVAILTATTKGRLAGTPAYMAPEQMGLEPLSPAADQFAFCVSLWEVLCGERPFEGDTMAALYTSVSRGQTRPPPPGSMPRWLHRVLQRGVKPKPEDRWPSMADLLDALERGRGRWRWQVGLASVATVVTIAGVAVGWQQRRAREHRERVEACEAEGAAIHEIWNDGERARLRSGLLATGVHFAEDSADILIPWLDDYRDEWSSGRTEACMHGSIWRDWDAELLDRSTWCFEDRRLQLEATVEQIATSSRAGARRAVRLASYLDPVSTCLDPSPLRRLPVPPMELRDEIRAIRAMLTESDSLHYSGRYDEALATAQQALARAEALDWPPLRALARLLLGRRMFMGGQAEQSEAELTESYFEAQDAGSLEIAFRAARSLVNALPRVGRYREAAVWARHAQVLAPQLPDPSGLDEAEGHFLLTSVYRGLGDYEAAVAEGRLAVSMRAEVLGVDHPITAAAMSVLGLALFAQGRVPDALEQYERSCEIWEHAVGHEHPTVGDLLRSRAEALFMMGRIDDALDTQRDGLSVLEAVFGPDHPAVAGALFVLGRILARRGDLEEAERALRRASAIYLEHNGPDHPLVVGTWLRIVPIDVARGLHDDALERCERALATFESSRGYEPGLSALALEFMADVLVARGRVDQAVQRQEEAIAHRESATPPSRHQLATALEHLGDLLRTANELEDARRSYQRALSIGERTVGADEPSVVPSLTGLAEVALASGQRAEALRLAERAVTIVQTKSPGPAAAGPARFVLARALVAAEDPTGRARALAEAALVDLTTAYDDRRIQVEQWLQAQRDPTDE